MNITTAIIAIIVCAASVPALVKFMHMFQLSGYKAAAYFRWLKANPGKAVFGLPAKNAKKPLVYTGRVTRMFVTLGVLFLAAVAAALFAPAPFGIIALIVYFLLTPVLPIIVNFINAPAEAAVRAWYIRDAKKILASHPALTVIGITGSYGKTSFKYALAHILKARFETLMTPESYNTPMGVTITIRGNLRPTHEIFVCEMGAKFKGDIKAVCDIVSPEHGVITSIGEQHLETFKTIEMIVATKMELADAVKGKGMLYLGADSKTLHENIPAQPHTNYGIGADNDCRAFDISLSPQGTVFSVALSNGETLKDLRMPLVGEHNVINITGATALALALGVPESDIRQRLLTLKPAPHRLELITRDGLTILDDSYNSNPAGTTAALRTLSLFDGQKILVTPGMVELGAAQDEENKKFGERAATVCDRVYLIGARQTKPIRDGLIAGGFAESRIITEENFAAAMAKIQTLPAAGDKVVLIENDLPDNY